MRALGFWILTTVTAAAQEAGPSFLDTLGSKGTSEGPVGVFGKKHRHDGNSERFMRLSFSGDGKRCAMTYVSTPEGASSADEQGVLVWNLTGKEPSLYAKVVGYTIPAFAKDSQRMAAASIMAYGGATLFDLSGAEFKVTANTESEGYAREFAFSPDGKYLAAATFGGIIHVWEPSNGQFGKETRFKGHQGYMTSMEFCRDGKTLASGSRDCTARLWELPSGTVRTSIPHSSDVRACALSPDGKRLATTTYENVIRVFDASGKEGKELFTLEGQKTFPYWIVSPIFLPDNRTLATLETTWDLEKPRSSVTLWNAKNGKKIKEWDAPGQFFQGMVLAPDGRHLAALHADSTVHVYRLPKKAE